MENNLKRFLSLLLALVMVIGLMPVGHVHAEEGNTINLVVGNTHEITLDGDYSALKGTGNETVGVDAAFAPQMTGRTAALAFNIEEGEKYVLVNTRLWKALEYNTSGNNRLFCRETVANAPAWTIKASTVWTTAIPCRPPMVHISRSTAMAPPAPPVTPRRLRSPRLTELIPGC